MKHEKKPPLPRAIGGVVAAAPRPTALAAALVATAVTFPLALGVLIYELMF